MKSLAIGALAALLLPALASTADAKPRKKYKPQRHYAMAQPYPYATERQRANALAYDNGGYFERIQSAHAFGSRGWWELQNRGGGSHR